MSKILIVDDANIVRVMLKDKLEKLGHEIVGEASDGDEAIAKFKELKPDLVTLDIAMPKIDGIECLKQIKQIDNNVKVIMLSSYSDEVRVKSALKAGALGYLLKPTQDDKLRQTLLSVLEH